MKNVNELRRKITSGANLFNPGMQQPRVAVIPKALPHILTLQPKCYAHFWDRAIGIDENRLNWWQE